MKYALIGCGRISGSHIGAALGNGLEVAALCDIYTRAASGLAAKHGLSGVKIYNDHREMLRAEKPGLVAVATYSGTHADIAVDCINAGCHTIIEKPVALSLADADRIIAAERRAGVKVCANHQNRFNEAVQQLRGAMLGGRFGQLLYGTASIRWARGDDYYSSADWRGTWAQDGGALMNQCIHAIDLLRWMMGGELTEVTGLTANQLHPKIEAEDFGAALLKFSNGSVGILDGTVNMPGGDYEETLTVFGSRGLVKLGGNSVNKVIDWRFDGAESEAREKTLIAENPPSVYGFGHKSLYADMLEAIRTGREPYVTSQAGRMALETVLAVYLSAKEGRTVKLPLGDCSTLDFA